MVQVTTVTVDPGGSGDYLDVASAAADVSTILTTAYGTTDLRGFAGGSETRIELVGGTYNFTTQLAFNTPTVFFDENNYLVLAAAPGAEANGEFKRAGSAIIEWTGATGNLFYVVEQFMRFEDLSIEWAGNNGPIVLDRNGCRITRCMLERNNNTTGGSIIGVAGTPNATYFPIVLEDSVMNLNSAQFIRGIRADDANFDFINCTFNNMQGTSNLAYIRAQNSDTDLTFTNCILNHRGRGTLLQFSNNGNVLTVTGSGNIEANHSQALDVSTNQGGVRWTFSTDVTDASTGSTIIWDDTTGLMYDTTAAPGNDAWQVLTSLVGTNSTDIQGLTRNVSGFNPGAYEAAVTVTPPDPIGTGDLTAPGPAMSASGSMTVGGTAAGSTAGPEAEGTASQILPVTGTMAGTVGAAQVAAEGSGPTEASGVGAVGAPTLTAAGSSTLSGTLAGTLAGPQMTASALVNGTFVTDGNTTVTPASIAGAGSQALSGTSALTTATAAAAATGAMSSGSAGVLTVGAASMAAAGSLTISGAGDLTGPGAAANAENQPPILSTGNLQVGAAAFSAQASAAITASGQLTLDFSLVASGGALVGATGALSLGPALAAAATESIGGSAPTLITGATGLVSAGSQLVGATGQLVSGETGLSAGINLIPNFAGYITLRTGRVSAEAKSRLRAGPSGAVMHAAAPSCSGQGGMINIPKHSRGAGIILS